MSRVGMDFITANGEATGDVAAALTQGQLGRLRPYRHKNKSYVTINHGTAEKEQLKAHRITGNAAALRREDWIHFDDKLVEAKRLELRAYDDLKESASYGGFDAFGTMILESEAIDDVGEAHVDFDGLSEGRSSHNSFLTQGVPLPIIHSGFSYSERELAVSRKRGTPLSTTRMGQAARRCFEVLERMTIGNQLVGQFTPANAAQYRRNPRIYGYLNYPDRTQVTDLTSPSAGGYSPSDTLDEVLAIIGGLQDDGFNGPYDIYFGSDWFAPMNADYSDAKGTNTLRQRLLDIEDVQNVKQLRYLTSPTQMIIRQRTEDVARAIDGMPFTTVQWSSRGNLEKHFKVLGIQVPEIRSDAGGRCGIVDADVS